jgi:HK97 family phage major capsid protein
MPYNGVIARGDTNEFPADLSTEIVQNATEASAALDLFRVANVSKRQNRFPVLSALPTAYWVNGDTGLKQTTQMAWANKTLNIEELACIVPVPENVIDDADFDVWGEVQPRVEEAIARALDDAIFFGTNAPATFPTNVTAAATAAGNKFVAASTPAQGGAFGDMDETYALLEADGFDSEGWILEKRMKARLRRARNTTGERLDAGRLGADLNSIDGDPIRYMPAGLAPATFLGLTGDWTKFVVGVRKDITMKVLDQAVIQDNTGAIIYNLAQQDMVAIRVTFRAGWEFANPINRDNPNGATRYPASLLATA